MNGRWIVGAAILATWHGALLASRAEVDGRLPDALHFTVCAIAGLVTGALALRRGEPLGRSILTGASLAIVPALFAAIQEWTAKPAVDLILVPSGPRVAPLTFAIIFAFALVPCAGGAAVGWSVARSQSARRSS
jgi:hypothetical protein